MSVLLCELKSKQKALIYLVIFAAASPAGLLASNFMLENNFVSSQSFIYLFALVSGNFLHISTTIVFESSMDHKFNAKKIGVTLIAALVAVAAETVL